MDVQILGASLPRSGHHYLETILEAVFGPFLGYCPGHGPNCCNAIPCTAPGKGRWHLRKSHDERLQLPRDVPNAVYLVQHRAPWPRILSYADFITARTKRAWPSAVDAAKWLALEAKHVIGFYQKWMHEPREDTLLIDYDRLTADPVGVVCEIAYVANAHLALDYIHERLDTIDHSLRATAPGQAATETRKPRDPTYSPHIPIELVAEYDFVICQACPQSGWTAAWIDLGIPPSRLIRANL